MLRVAVRRLCSVSASPWRLNQAATASSSVLSQNLIDGRDSSDDLRSIYFTTDFYLPSRGAKHQLVSESTKWE